MNNLNRSNSAVYKLVIISLIAAIYTVVSLLGASLSFSNIQVRFAEVLCLLPILFPWAIWGVTLGCFLTNLLGVVFTVNTLGIIDIVFGTLATFIAAYLTYRWRNIRFGNWPVLSALAPVVVNGIVIGLELALVFGNGDFSLFVLFALEVAAGELIACVLIGLPVIRQLERTGLFKQV
ncbi:MAG: QueT transporter family protein [Erysipelotrichaceae bacterium]|nr:QueT transporter family protein [Erysipelotrichaceae bacterium]